MRAAALLVGLVVLLGLPPTDSLTPEEAYLLKLRKRKAAIERLALEDALGKEVNEQASAEASVLSNAGSAAMLSSDDQKQKLMSYAADLSEAVERARQLKQQAEAAQADAASVMVMTVARAQPPSAVTQAQAQRKKVFDQVKGGPERAVVAQMLDAVAKEEVADEAAHAADKAEAAQRERAKLSDEAERLASRAFLRGPHVQHVLALRQQWDDLQRVRRLSSPDRLEGDGSERVVGALPASIADAMGYVDKD